MSDSPLVTAAILIIGDEILSGRTIDKNLPWLAEQLNQRGIQLREARVIGDVQAEIVAATRELKAKWSYVFTTGGIGPTHDDITAAAMAAAFDTPIEVNAEARRRLEAYYPMGELTDARLRMAMIPVGARLIDNPVSAAPGFILENVHVMAGVPRIMQAMFLTVAESLTGGTPLLSRTVTCLVPESRIADPLGALAAAHPAISMGSYPFFDGLRAGTRIVLRGPDAAVLEQLAAEVVGFTQGLGASAILEPTDG